MLSKISKWGNSLGIRIPLMIVKELNLQSGDKIKIHFKDSKIVIEPVSEHKYSLEELLKGVNENNLHSEEFLTHITHLK
ncbi:MAG TPA: AbrB/MazE/SpoVT family DNA-binding domain-containing protein [Caldisericia bacterium]|nr:AbrB/MazE/SpoVT family DNA-binding domain-containing protein [Caldisericia bacterium]